MDPYYADDQVTLFLGDCREIVPTLAPVDLIVADPPYGETSLAWDKWPDGWPTAVSEAAKSMWCFGSMRMFLDRRDEFAAWRLSQDVVWEKNEGSGMQSDRFRRIHEQCLHWYRGAWADIYVDPPREPGGAPAGSVVTHGSSLGNHWGGFEEQRSMADGMRLVRSVIRCRNMRFRNIHPTEKPVGILDPLIRYGCPPGGTVLDPFAGSGSTAEAARLSGRKAVLVEADERYCEVIARRMSQAILEV